MDIYILRDLDPVGGYYCAQDWLPVMADERDTVVECRVVTMPSDMWAAVLAGGLHVDEDGTNDTTWAGWWTQGTLVWMR